MPVQRSRVAENRERNKLSSISKNESTVFFLKIEWTAEGAVNGVSLMFILSIL